VIEALDHTGLWARYLPEWDGVRNKPQRNAYHRFTVDRHLLEAAANAACLTDRVDRPDLLLLGGLLHDIGKGRRGDHTVVGMELVRTIGARMGLLDRPDRLGRSDLAAGHVRVYTWDTLSEVIFAAGLRVVSMEGLLLRPLPNALMESWPTDLRSAFFDLSYCAPRLCSEILAVCGHPESA